MTISSCFKENRLYRECRPYFFNKFASMSLFLIENYCKKKKKKKQAEKLISDNVKD